MSLLESLLADYHDSLTSDIHSKKNYLFLLPVDQSNFFDYITVVATPMDFQTIGQNLGKYTSEADFWSDVELVFANCELYNGRNASTKFCVKVAQQMRKVAAKIRGGGMTLAKPRGKPIKVKMENENEANGAGGWSSIASGSDYGDGGAYGGSQDSTMGSPVRAPALKLSLKAPEVPSTDLWTPAIHKKPVMLLLNFLRRLHAVKSGGVMGDRIVQSAHNLLNTVPSAEDYKGRVNVYADHPTYKGDTFTDVEKVVRHGTVAHIRALKVEVKLGWGQVAVLDEKPIDMSLVKERPEDGYRTVNDAFQDIRNVVANRIRYYPGEYEKFVPYVTTIESFLEYNPVPCGRGKKVPRLLPHWKILLEMLIKLMMDPPKDFDITLFTYPIPSYFGNALPLHYIQLIKDEKGVSELMDLGSLMGKLMTAQYRERTGYGEFFQDFDRVAGNCMRFHRNSPSPDAAGYVAMGGKLKGYCKSYKDWFFKNILEPKVKPTPYTDPKLGAFRGELKKEPMLALCQTLRKDQFQSRGLKYDTMVYFIQPVQDAEVPDYRVYIEKPTCLTDIENRIKRGFYKTPEQLDYDMMLIFDNAIHYNSLKAGFVMLEYGYAGGRAWRKLYTPWIKKISDNPQSVLDCSRGTAASGSIGGDKGNAPIGGFSMSREATQANMNLMLGGKRALSPAQPGSALAAGGGAKRQRLMSPIGTSTAATTTLTGTLSAATSSSSLFSFGLPLAAPISALQAVLSFDQLLAEVVSDYDMRNNEEMEVWERECNVFLRELKKHPWLSGKMRPKGEKFQVIFTCPVTKLWPTLTDEYARRIKQPMDLTTIECRLVEGGKRGFKDRKDFLRSVTTCFTNAMDWNREDYANHVTVPSMYFEAGEHLAKYTRWLSMAGREDGWFWLDSDSAGEKGDDKFDVTEAGRKKLKEEMDAIFMSEDQQTMGWEVGRFGGKRLPGFSEKQMDFVLHQLKAVKYRPTMVSFMAPVYPADYDSVCVKRMDYAVCATKFKENGYKSYKDFVGDVRLMFSNALKYNTRFRGVHPVSNAICESAESMQPIVEKIVDKMRKEVCDHRGVTRAEGRNRKRLELDVKNEAKMLEEEAAKREIDDKVNKMKFMEESISKWDASSKKVGGQGQQDNKWSQALVILKKKKEEIERDRAEMDEMLKQGRAERALGMGEEGLQQLDREMMKIEIPPEPEVVYDMADEDDEFVDAGAVDDEDGAWGGEGGGDDGEDDYGEVDEVGYMPLRVAKRRVNVANVGASDDAMFDGAMMNEENEQEIREREKVELDMRRDLVKREIKELIQRQEVGEDCVVKLFEILCQNAPTLQDMMEVEKVEKEGGSSGVFSMDLKDKVSIMDKRKNKTKKPKLLLYKDLIGE